MAKCVKYLIPSMLSLTFLYLTWYWDYYYFFLILLLANVLNGAWGEFTNEEIRAELHFFYKSTRARFVKILNAIILLGVFGVYLYVVDSGRLSSWHLVGFTVSVGVLTGCFVVTLAHDLLHSHTHLEQSLASLLLLVAGIPHFTNDHLFGHHRMIGLREDETTAKLGDSFYTYFRKAAWFRLKCSYFSSYPLPRKMRFQIKLANVVMALSLLTIYAGIWLFAQRPLAVLGFFVGQGFVSYVLYELINYIQHYGLQRKIEPNGKREPIRLEHAWNCYYKYTNYILFLLPIHSVHHLPTARKARNLMGPRLPYLYFVMVALALAPKLWFEKMNPLAARHQDKK
ncbi:alkane 1-monooxygenase [Rhabdobacter roseus]|uniref:Alkane 1-monooxygenase n=1 Tax=Rhabdobacter roseus TaxID=1655419 RepID=A0A840TW78_9BACT|nr:fatty acid desaturase [Rhabdobacter roseus]MBB5283899.1 alkane 1-monooxygenase [Rhabdobacter roseus]